jgi:hypothetical protein
VGEDAEYSQPATVDIATLFNSTTAFSVVSVAEMSLTANQQKAAILERREQSRAWYQDDGADEHEVTHPWRSLPPLHFQTNSTITLGPLEIKTFELVIKH